MRFMSVWNVGLYENTSAIPMELLTNPPLPRGPSGTIAPVKAGAGRHHHQPEQKEVQPLVRFDCSVKRLAASEQASGSARGHLCRRHPFQALLQARQLLKHLKTEYELEP